MRLSSEDQKAIDSLSELLRATRREEQSERTKTEEKIVELKKKITQLEIDKSKIEEDNARERREIEHKVGLEKKRQEMELELAKREAIVEVREANLDADRKRFEDQMRFTTERFEKEAAAVHEMMGEVLKRLPNFSEHVEMALGNGRS
jgi:hypothetical protein